jgi:hypothetical protein
LWKEKEKAVEIRGEEIQATDFADWHGWIFKSLVAGP